MTTQQLASKPVASNLCFSSSPCLKFKARYYLFYRKGTYSWVSNVQSIKLKILYYRNETHWYRDECSGFISSLNSPLLFAAQNLKVSHPISAKLPHIEAAFGNIFSPPNQKADP